MHHKAIKAEIRKQLKTRYPHWQRLTKKEKKAIAKKVLDEVVNNYDLKQEVT
ncbi:MAG: transposase, partial [Deltaproteobacteria bacterium]